MRQNPYSKYKTMEVTTTDPLKLVVLLYDGAISALKRAKEHIGRKDYMSKYKELMKAHDIVFELMACLDKEKGGDVAENLNSLYAYMLSRIMEANNSLDFEILDEIIGLLDNLNESWKELAKRRGIEMNAGGKQPIGSAPAPNNSLNIKSV